MKTARNFVVLAAGLFAATGAFAEGQLFSTEGDAAQACGADTVVWIDLDRGRFYQKGAAEYGKGNNGGYGCLKQAHSKYRAGHSG